MLERQLAQTAIDRTFNPRPDEHATLLFPEFKRLFWHGYIPTSYHVLIDQYLAQVAEYIESGGQRGIDRLMINIPVRHGKTRSSQMFMGWMIGRNPDLSVITASYNATLAERSSREVRKLLQDERFHQHFPDVRLADDSAAVHRWNTAGHDGGMLAVGVGGGVAGHGGRLIYIDDVVRSRADAESPTYRQRSIDWWTNDILTRLEQPGGAIIFTNTRWQLHDLAGWILDNEGDEWTVLTLPALSGDNDLLGRERGEALWPERYGIDYLAKQRERIGEYAFASLYQQSPLPPGGGLFDTAKIDIVETSPICTKIVRFYDLAVTAKKHSDYTAGIKMGVTEDEKFIILDVYRVQKELPDVQEAIVQLAAIDGQDVPIRLEAEKAGIIQMDFLLRDSRMRPYTMDIKPPIGDKYTRATPFATRVNARKVMIVKAAWNRAFLDELSVFPGEKDDQVDACSGAYDMLATIEEVVFMQVSVKGRSIRH